MRGAQRPPLIWKRTLHILWWSAGWMNPTCSGGPGTDLPSAEDPQASEGPAAVVTAGHGRRRRQLGVGR